MLNMRRHIFLFLAFLLITGMVYAQQGEYKPNAKAEKAFGNALEHYRERDADKAEKELIKAIRLDSLFIDPYLLLADINYDRKKLDKVIDLYEKVLSIDPNYSSTVYYLLGKACLDNGDNTKASLHLNSFLSMKGITRDQMESAYKMLVLSQFREEALKNPIPFQPVNLGALINSRHDEFVNSITLDESRMIFTLMQPDTTVDGRFREGFVMAERKDSEWVVAGRALPDLYELGNIGAMSLSPDGRFLFFTSCGAAIGYGSCDLYVCGEDGDGWSKPFNLGDKVNTSNWDSQPCFSADGQTLYFSSARSGGYGGSDLWYTIFIQGKGWTRPINAGPNINTDHEEMAPYIHADGQSMYFSSKGHPGMGGFDLFISRMDSTGQWQKAENLGYPVNTSSDEINIVVATNGKGAYLSSDLEEGYGGYDIYSFELPANLAPQKVTYIEGFVYDAETMKAVEAEIQLLDLETSELKVRCESGHDGHYIAALPGGNNYALHVSKPGYLFYSENFNLSINEVPEEPVKKDIHLQPVKSGQSFVLNNIFFDTDEYVLNELSTVELYKLNAFLIINPEVEILICGHTDDVGTAEYNQTLSERRAKAVYSFMVELGIQPARLKYKGFGKAQPVSDNDTEEGRAENRRTEIQIL